MTPSTRICSWSGPRNISTALMYAFRQRSDTTVVDEPLYAHYLSSTGIWHPGRADVLAAQDNDGVRVVKEVMLGDAPSPVVFFKHIAYHSIGLDWSFMEQMQNIILTRHPARVLASFSENVDTVGVETTGLPTCTRILDFLIERDRDPVVVDSRELQNHPESVLGQMCERLGLEFDRAMLSWPAGPVPEDGVWAEHWYGATHRSTGFQPYEDKEIDLPDHLSAVVAECMPMYERLLELAIRAES